MNSFMSWVGGRGARAGSFAAKLIAPLTLEHADSNQKKLSSEIAKKEAGTARRKGAI